MVATLAFEDPSLGVQACAPDVLVDPDFGTDAAELIEDPWFSRSQVDRSEDAELPLAGAAC